MAVLGAASQAPEPPDPSKLPLALVGVIVDSATPANSVCLIRCTYPTSRVRSFGPGENVCDVAQVAGIRDYAVVITNLLTNRAELLALPQAGSSPAAPAPETGQAREAAAPALRPPVVRAASGTVTIDVAEASVTHYLANLPELLASARATPRYQKNGFGQQTVDGFEIDQVRPGGVVEQMGLRNGDAVLEVNGQPLDSLASVIRIFGEAQSLAQSKMTVLRDGQRMTFVLNRRREEP